MHITVPHRYSQRSPLRNFLMYSFHTILKTLGVGHIRDTQCGFKVRLYFCAMQCWLTAPSVAVHSPSGRSAVFLAPPPVVDIRRRAADYRSDSLHPQIEAHVEVR